MFDKKIVNDIVVQKTTAAVEQKLAEIFAGTAWLAPIEQKIVEYAQERIVSKFNNSDQIPELVATIKQAVKNLFDQGTIPGIESFIDETLVRSSVEKTVNDLIKQGIENLLADAVWLNKVESAVNHNVLSRTMSTLQTLNPKNIVCEHVDRVMEKMRPEILKQVARPGIQDIAKQCELSVLDDYVVVENNLVSKKLNVVDHANVKNLTVGDISISGSISTDNKSWQDLADTISEKTLKKLTNEWQQNMVDTVKQNIESQGIDFDTVKVQGKFLVENDALASSITQSNLQSVGHLKKLSVVGEAHINNTLSVANRRVGINTETPEMALSVWDEEVNVLSGKFKEKTAFVGTGRLQNLCLGVNRTPYLEIDTDGMTTVKKLQIGNFKISFGTEVPNYSGARGDIVFNSNAAVNNNVFAWQCLGGFRWKLIRSVE